MTATTYYWKSGARVALDAQVTGTILERVRVTNNGRLAPRDVLAEATPKSSPLHPYFEWNNGKAANKYRIEQAKYLIRSIDAVTVERAPAPPIRAFVSVVRGEDRSYTSTAHALSDPELREQVLHAAWREFDALRAKHRELSEFAAVFGAIDQARPR